jgi:small subunit ribosomal protein S6
MRDYELGFILNPEVNEEQTRTILDRVEQVVARFGGQIVRVNQWGRRRLGYPIEHHRDGFYVFVDMILTPETVVELERTLKVSEEVLRHMVKRRDPKTVQKEREARAAAAVAAAANPTASNPTAANAEVAVLDEMEPADEEFANEDIDELPLGLSPEDIADVPPAIEEDAIEADVL